MVTPLGVYISVPFCKAKCTFCNFASDVHAPGRLDAYIDRLCAEISQSRALAATRNAILPDQVDTLYFGGGTPSLLTPHHLRTIFDQLRQHFTLAPNAEITLECAPGQLADTTLEELLRQGMNRMSFGVQSFVDRESAAVGRLHTQQRCLDELARVRSVGIDDVNIDLIAGLPHQTEASWRYSLQAAIATAAPHVSVYMLEVDEDSRLGKEMLSHGSRYSAATVPSEDDTADWYQLACNTFAAARIAQYEISNFARHGHQSRHNLKYWHRDPYLGFGLDAHSMLPTPTAAIRFANTDDLDAYLAQPSASPLQLFNSPAATPQIDHITPEAAFEESLFLGLRLNSGVNLHQLRTHFGEAMLRQTLPALHEVSEAGLLEITPDLLRLTDRGRMASNEVFSRLLLTPA